MGKMIFRGYVKYFLLLSFVLGTSARAVDPELAVYEKCLQDLHATIRHYETTIPFSLLYQDRKLVHMIQGADVLQTNLDSIRFNLAGNPLAVYEGHLIGNAVIACRDYQATFEARSKKLIWFLFFALGSAIFAVLHFFFTHIPQLRKKAALAAPQDQIPTARRK